jgi:hypothetical protein
MNAFSSGSTPVILAAGEPGVVAHGNRLQPSQRGGQRAVTYHTGSSPQQAPRADTLAWTMPVTLDEEIGTAWLERPGSPKGLERVRGNVRLGEVSAEQVTIDPLLSARD